MRLAALALLGACNGTTGTVTVKLTTAPGSTVLDAVTRLRVTLTSPHQVEETGRNASNGFDLALSFDANGEIAALIVEGLDASGALVATGESPPFPIGPTDAKVVIYLAAPLSVAPAPVSLGAARSGVAGAPLPYGAVFAGGRDAQAAPTDAISVYNAYDHTLAGGQAMPIKRADFAIGASSTNAVYLIGGVGSDGAAVNTVLRFDTTVQPAGAYTSLGDQPAFARSGEIVVPVAADRFLLTGSPPAELVGETLAARSDIATLPAVGASVVPGDGIVTAVFVGAAGLVRFRDDHFDMLAGTGRLRAAITGVPATGKLVIAGGGTPTTAVRDVLVVDPETGTVETHTNGLAVGRFSPAIAATDRYVVVAGGVDDAGQPIATAEILDATSLAPVATAPIAARTGTIAFRLPNGQVLIGGTDLLELFTPPPPP